MILKECSQNCYFESQIPKSMLKFVDKKSLFGLNYGYFQVLAKSPTPLYQAI